VIARRQANAQASAGRLIHLAVHEGNFRRAQVVLLDDARFGHFLVEVAAFPGALADSRETDTPHGVWRCC